MNRDDAYLETQVLTATPHRLHLMVVDAAIRFAVHAEEALRERDIETAHFSLNNSRGFVSELIAGLNPEHAPEIVERMKALFVFVYRKLAEADVHRDGTAVAAALRVLRIHRETWVALSQNVERESTSDAASGERSWIT